MKLLNIFKKSKPITTPDYLQPTVSEEVIAAERKLRANGICPEHRIEMSMKPYGSRRYGYSCSECVKERLIAFQNERQKEIEDAAKTLGWDSVPDFRTTKSDK